MAGKSVGDTHISMVQADRLILASLPQEAYELADPTTLSLTLTVPGQLPVVYTYPTGIQRASLGIFYFQVLLTVAGPWEFLWSATGAVADTLKYRLFVRA